MVVTVGPVHSVDGASSSEVAAKFRHVYPVVENLWITPFVCG